MKDTYDKLLSLNVNEKVEKKQKLSYLSWTYAWTEILKNCPDATYKILKFDNNLPYVYDENTGYMCFTQMTISGTTHEMWLTVMDGANKAMKSTPYEYDTKYNGKKTCEAATMFDVNKTIMRCLVKNIAMFGLGLYIYAGEDLPEESEDSKKQKEESEKEAKIVYNKNIEGLLRDVIDCDTTDKLTQLWNEAIAFHKDEKFKKAVADLGKMLKDKNK